MNHEPPSYDVEIFFDSDCPLCRREISFVSRRDRHHRLRLTDIALPDFDAESAGKSREELMARIHGKLPSGEWVEGVEVFRRIYTAIGYRKLVALTRLPGIAQVLTLAYKIFAKNRLRLTGRSGARCTDETCAVPIVPPK